MQTNILKRSKESIMIEQKQKNIIFALLPARLVNSILEMMQPKEIPNLRCVCKWLKEYIDSNDNLVIIQVFSLFISKQIDFFCEYGDNEIFISERAHKNQLLSYSKYQTKWKHFLIQYEFIRESLQDSLSQIFLFYSSSNSSSTSPKFQPSLVGLRKLTLPLEKILSDKEGEDSILQGKSQQKEESQEKPSFELNIEQIESSSQNPSFELKQKNMNSELDLSISKENQNNLTHAQKMLDLSQKYIWQILRDPPLPILKLRRENIGAFCNTWFQNKLAEVLWEGSKKKSYNMEKERPGEIHPLSFLNSIVQEKRVSLIEEVKDACSNSSFLKDNFQNFRYYFYQHKSDYQIFSQQSPEINAPPFSIPSALVKRSSFQLSLKKSTEVKDNFKFNLSSPFLSESSPQDKSKNLPFKFFNCEEDASDSIFGNDCPNFFGQSMNSCTLPEDFDVVEEGGEEEEKESSEINEINFFNSTNLFKKQTSFKAGIQKVQQKPPALLQIVENIVQLALLKSEISFEFLKGHLNSFTSNSDWKRNGYDLLSEYNIQWRSYIAFFIHIEEHLKDVFEEVNESFNSIFEEYPQHPRISIWRTAIKIWIHRVYEKEDLKEHLFGCFFKVLSIRRQENFLFQMKQINLDNKVQKQYYMPNPLEALSLCLLNNLTKNKNFSLINYGEGYDYQHTFFSKNQYSTDLLLSDFTENILDLSINEISVHYLGHTEVQVDLPYKQLEKQLLDSSQEYFKHQKDMFTSSPSIYLTFLEGDLKYVSKIFKERSAKRLKVLMVDHWKQTFKDIIGYLIPKKLESFEKYEPKQKNLIIQHSKQLLKKFNTEKELLLQASLLNQQQIDDNPFPQSQQILTHQQNSQNNDESFKPLPKIGDFFVQLIFDILEESEKKRKCEQGLPQQPLLQFTKSIDSSSCSLHQSPTLLQSEGLPPLLPNFTFFNNFQNNQSLPSPIPPLSPFIFDNDGGSLKDTTTATDSECLNSEDILKIQEKSFILSQLFKMSEEQIKLSISSYFEIRKDEEETIKCDQDIEIEDLNGQRGLPLSLTIEEQQFFFLTNNLTEEIIQSTILKQREYISKLKSQNQKSAQEINSDEPHYQQNQELEGEEDDEDDQEEDEQMNELNDLEDSIEESLDEITLEKDKNNLKKKKKKRNSNIPIYNSSDELSDKVATNNHNDFKLLQKLPSLEDSDGNSSNFSLGLKDQRSWLPNVDQENNNNPREEQINQIVFRFSDDQQDNLSLNKKKSSDIIFDFEEKKEGENEAVIQNMFTFDLVSNDSLPKNEKKASLNKTNKPVDLFRSLQFKSDPSNDDSDQDQVNFFNFPIEKDQRGQRNFQERQYQQQYWND